MKKISFTANKSILSWGMSATIAFSILLGMSNCKGNKYSSAECEPVINQMFGNFTKDLKPEEVDKLTTLKSQLVPMLQKECMSGKYDLECLKNSTNVAAIQTCKKE